MADITNINYITSIVDINGNMFEIEENVLKAINNIGIVTTKKKFKKYYIDCSKIKIGLIFISVKEILEKLKRKLILENLQETVIYFTNNFHLPKIKYCEYTKDYVFIVSRVIESVSKAVYKIVIKQKLLYFGIQWKRTVIKEKVLLLMGLSLTAKWLKQYWSKVIKFGVGNEACTH